VPPNAAAADDVERQTPGEFLGKVRDAFTEIYRDAEPDEQLRDLTRRDLEKLGVTLAADPDDGYARVVAAISEEISSACAELYDVDLSADCAIGTLTHPKVNARCFRSPEGVYALVIHHGLMGLLHKFTKLVIAAHDPSQVIYCNRKDPQSLTTEELLEWADELGVNYLATGAGRGAMLKLSDRAMAVVSPIVHLAETFVLGHEVGHYLAGHLDDDARFAADAEVPWLEVLAENKRHEDEFEADAYGFEIMRTCSPTMPAEHTHSAIVGAFSMMGLIGGDRSSPSHPASSERYRRLAERYGLPSLNDAPG
jgi:hypothetical protein